MDRGTKVWLLISVFGVSVLGFLPAAFAESAGEVVTVSEDSAILSSLSSILPDKTVESGVLAHQPAAVNAGNYRGEEKAGCPIGRGPKMGFVPGNCKKASA